jgi:hypothetical protein
LVAASAYALDPYLNIGLPAGRSGQKLAHYRDQVGNHGAANAGEIAARPGPGKSEQYRGFGRVLVLCNGVPTSLLDKSIGNQAIKGLAFITIQSFCPFHAPSGHDIAKDRKFFVADDDGFCHLTAPASSRPSALDLL